MKQESLNEQVVELLLQSLEHEKGGVQVYETALKCAVNEDLKEEWEEYLQQTTHHVDALTEVCGKLGIDASKETPGVLVVRHTGQSLVKAMEMALSVGKRDAAQLVACECVVLAETKDHSNWVLIGKCAEKLLKGDAAKALKKAYQEIEDEEDEHLYHSKGWCRELSMASLGIKAVLPPPEEQKDVKTAIGAARAKQARKELI